MSTAKASRAARGPNLDSFPASFMAYCLLSVTTLLHRVWPQSIGAAPPPAPAPRLAADTRAVLAEVLGLRGDAIDELVAQGAVFGADAAAPRQIAPAEIP